MNTIYKTNKHVEYFCRYYVVFCSKYRKDVLVGGVVDRLKEIIASTSTSFGFDVIDMRIEADTVYLQIDVTPQIGIHKVVKHIKGKSSRLLREEFPHLRSRIPTLWTNAYFVSTIGDIDAEKVDDFVKNQIRV